MVRPTLMRRDMPDGEQGIAGKKLPLTPMEQLVSDERELEALFAAMVRVAGGVDWLVSAMDKAPSYASKISEGMYGRNGKQVQLRWLAPLLGDPAAVDLLMGWLSERLGYQPPVRERTVSPEEIARAAVEVIGEMGALRDPVREAIAKRLGVRVEDVKL